MGILSELPKFSEFFPHWKRPRKKNTFVPQIFLFPSLHFCSQLGVFIYNVVYI